MKKIKAVGIQYAALPYRRAGRRLEILLITSRETRRWVIPKGWPMKGRPPHEAAAIEAAEEAGVVGDIKSSPIGSYRYVKQLKEDEIIPIQVIVFPMAVDRQAVAWKEQGQRDQGWFDYAQAASLVTEPNLKRLIRDFGEAHGAGLWSSATSLLRRFEKALLGGRR